MKFNASALPLRFSLNVTVKLHILRSEVAVETHLIRFEVNAVRLLHQTANCEFLGKSSR